MNPNENENRTYYLVFENVGDNIFQFDTVLATNGKNALGGKHYMIGDPEYHNRVLKNTAYYKPYPVITLYSNTIEEIINGKGFSVFADTNNPKQIFLKIDSKWYHSMLLSAMLDHNKSADEAKRIVATLLFQMGDYMKYIVSEKRSVYCKPSDKSMKETGVRNPQYVAMEVGLPLLPNKDEVNRSTDSKIIRNNDGKYGYIYKDPDLDKSIGRGGIEKAPDIEIPLDRVSEDTPRIMGRGNEKKEQPPKKEKIDKTKLSEIIGEIKKDLIGQDDALYTVLLNMYTNQLVIDKGDKKTLKTQKTNIILDGPTGTGKTLLLSLISENLSLPMVLTPITQYSSAGYRGADLTDILVNLMKKAKGNQELAERGIVALDEFDKLGIGKDKEDIKMKKAVQQELLSYISGAKINIEYEGKQIEFDTSKITFVGMGAFNDLRERKIKEKKKKGKSSIGFGSSKPEDDQQEEIREYEITPQDYVAEGLIPELVGRFTTLAATQTLTKERLEEIINEGELSPLKGLQAIGELSDVTITVDDDIVSEVAAMAYDDNFGARGLQTIFNNIKNVVLRDLLLGNIHELRITNEILQKSKRVSVRSY